MALEAISDPKEINAQMLVAKISGSNRRSLLAGMSSPKTTYSSFFTGDFLYRIYDAKAITSKVMQNYLEKQKLDQMA